MDRNPVRIRAATPADAEAIARVHVAAWQHAYQDRLPAEYLAGLRWEQRHEFWARELADPAAGTTTLVAVGPDRTILGFATVGPCRDGDRARADQWELYGIYLHPKAWRHGVGRLLAAESLDLVPQTAVDVSLWVLEGNTGAIAFYDALGFAADGQDKRASIGGRSVRELRLIRARPTH